MDPAIVVGSHSRDGPEDHIIVFVAGAPDFMNSPDVPSVRWFEVLTSLSWPRGFGGSTRADPEYCDEKACNPGSKHCQLPIMRQPIRFLAFQR